MMRTNKLKLANRFKLKMSCASLLERLAEGGFTSAEVVLGNNEMLKAFCEESLSIQHRAMGGKLGDALAALLQSFIDDPEKWISVVISIIGLFGDENA